MDVCASYYVIDCEFLGLGQVFLHEFEWVFLYTDPSFQLSQCFLIVFDQVFLLFDVFRRQIYSHLCEVSTIKFEIFQRLHT